MSTETPTEHRFETQPVNDSLRDATDVCRRAAKGDLEARILRIDISGSGFLYNMVRIIAGTQVSTLAGTPGVVGFADGTGSAARFAGMKARA